MIYTRWSLNIVKYSKKWFFTLIQDENFIW